MPRPDPATTSTLALRVGCRFGFEATVPSPAALMVEPVPSSTRFARWNLPGGLDVPGPVTDSHGNRVRRLLLPEGACSVEFDAIVDAPADLDPDPGDATQALVQDLPAAVLEYLLPSRYCESDRLLEFAFDTFGSVAPGADRVRAVCDWVHGHLAFAYGTSGPTFSACDVKDSGRGVCRDFAHLAVALCRALTIPARYAFGYLPDIGVPPSPNPMDFCAWTEVFLGGTWWTFDPRNNARRVGRVLVGRGRDAADVAMVTTWGPVTLQSMAVVAEGAV